MKKIYLYLLPLVLFVPTITFGADRIPPIKSGFGTHIFNATNTPSIKALAFTPDGKELWGTSLLNNKIGTFVFDAATGAKKNIINLENGGGVELVFSKDGTKVYISQMETAKVFELDTTTKQILRTFKTGGNWTKVLFLSEDGKTLYATNWLSNDVSVIDIETGVLLKKIKTIKTPRGVYVTDDNKNMYVVSFDTGELQKINLLTNEKKIIYNSKGALRHIVADAKNNVLYISDMLKGLIYKVNIKDDSVTNFTTTDSHPNTIELMYDAKVLAVSSRGVNNKKSYSLPGPTWGSIQLFDTTNGNLIDSIIGGNQPTALGIASSTVAFSNFLDKSIEAYQFSSYDTLLQKSASSTWVKDYKKYLIK